MAFPTGWGRKQPITIDNTQVAGSVDFISLPALITLDHLNSEIVDAGGNSALNGGGDVRFSSDEAGTVQLSIDIEQFITNAVEVNRRCTLWVNVPSVSYNSDTTIWIWYSKAGESQPADGASFGRNSVWPNRNLRTNLSSVTPIDSSGNQTLTATDVTSGVGENGLALDFNGTSTFINIGDGILPIFDFSQTVKFRADTLPNFAGLVGSWFSGDTGRTYVGTASNNTNWDGYGTFTNLGSATLSTGVWYRLTVTRSGSSVTVILNGASDTTLTDSSTGPDNVNNTVIGALTGGTSFFFNGLMEYVEISTVAVSIDRELTIFNNENDPASFATAGTPEAGFPVVGGTILLQTANNFYG